MIGWVDQRRGELLSEKRSERSYVNVPDDWELVESDGVGPFETRMVYRLPDGSEYVWESRRNRKGRGAKKASGRAAESATSTQESRKENPWLEFWAPHRISWWVAVLYFVGSALFILGAMAALFPEAFSGSIVVSASYFAGALVFTIGVYVQLLETINQKSYVGTGPRDEPTKGFEWFAWQPGRLSFLEAFVLLVGSVLFNIETTLALAESLGWVEITYLIGLTSLAGSVLFVAGTYMQLPEICHEYLCWRPREISWWVALLSFLGCVGFLVGSVFGLDVPGLLSPSEPLVVKLSFLQGSVFFAIASYLMLPEMFSE